ncbi:outer membrane beta-barrel protein [Joostella sp. CR20]|uniref:outer membrane beta-barrel protein n=1 Tax=Joostella sp. CR20 TaxID=2804312 RepID=UPI00313B3A7A
MKHNYNKVLFFSTLIALIGFPLLSSAQDEEPVINFSKGKWHTGITLSVNTDDDDDIENILFNISKNEQENFEINFTGGYFVKDNMSIGLQYSYLKHSQDLNYQTDDESPRYQSAKSVHTFTGFLRNYYPVTANHRLNFFNETNLGVGFGNTNTRHTKSEDDITKTFNDEFNLRLGVKPGVAVILTEGFAFEVALKLLGLDYTHSDITTNGIKQGSSSDFKLDFDISLLSLDFGLAYYF